MGRGRTRQERGIWLVSDLGRSTQVHSMAAIVPDPPEMFIPDTAHFVFGGILVDLHRLHSAAGGGRAGSAGDGPSPELSSLQRNCMPPHLWLSGAEQMLQPMSCSSISCMQERLHRPSRGSLGSVNWPIQTRSRRWRQRAGLPINVQAWRAGVPGACIQR